MFFYLGQSLHIIQKPGIGESANMFNLFHQDEKILKYFYENTISGDMNIEVFMKFCYKA